MKIKKQLVAWVAAGALGIAAFGTATAGVDPDWATVTGHAPHSAANNDPDTWGEDCVKWEAGEGDLGLEQDTYVLGASYGLVVVKSGSGEFANTLFANASAGETVWADTNGNNVFDEGDQGISHIIFCDEVEETEAPSEVPSDVIETDEPSQSVAIETDEPSDVIETDEPSQSVAIETDEPSESPFQSVEGDTDEPSEPDTATIGGSKHVGSPADGAWLLVVALGVLLASVVVLTPARAKAPRR